MLPYKDVGTEWIWQPGEPPGRTGHFCNGATSGRLYRKYAQPLTGLEAVVLPSTSPANAAFTMPRLLDAWGTALEGYVNKP